MANNTNLMEEISESSTVISQELLQTAIRSKKGNDNIVVKEFVVKQGSEKGENYASNAFAVDVTTKRDGEEKVIHLFIKTMPNDGFLKEIAVRGKIYSKEGVTYSHVVPDMIHCQYVRGVEPFGPSVPPFYYSNEDESNGILILENIAHQGYMIADKGQGLNYDHCKVVMKEIAVFQALSFAVKNKNPENMKRYDNLFHDAVFHSGVSAFYKESMKHSIQLVKKVTDDPNIKKSVEKLNLLDLDKTFKEFLEPVEPYAAICHGDFWCNNLLFKYENGVKTGTPVNCKLLDWQCVRYALPTTDLAYFFYTSTTKATRDRYLTELLGLYHSTFIDSLNKLGIQLPNFTMSVLANLFKERAMYGILMICMELTMILPKPKDVDDLTDMTEASMSIFLDEFFNRMAEDKDNDAMIKTRLIGAIEDAVKMGLI